MKIVVLICRILLGLLFVLAGAFGVFHPVEPANMPPQALAWSMALYVSGWGRVLSGVQLLGGLMVLSGFLLPVGLVLLCAETFNILCFHLFLTGGHMIAPGLATGVLELVVLYGYCEIFRPLFAVRVQPSI